MKQNILQVIMVAMLIAGSYLVGVYKTKVEYLEKGVGTQPTQQVTQQGQESPTTVDLEKVKSLFDGKHITFGDAKSKLIFVEISDPSCPYCHAAGGKNPELNNQMGAQFKLVSDGGSYVAPVEEMRKLVEAGKASFAWIYTPGHGNGELGTQALYCAHEKGKFWEAHDLLMSNKGYDILNDTVKNDVAQAKTLVDFLKPAGVADMEKCLTAGTYKSHITDDTAFVQGLGFGATPTFFINDQVVEGAASWDNAFKPIVDPLL